MQNTANPLNASQQFHTIQNAFEGELQKISHRSERLNIGDIAAAFSNIVRMLLGLNAVPVSTLITAMDSLVVKAEIRGENMYVEIFFDNVTGHITNTVINIFHQQSLQFNATGSLDSIILDVKQYFKSKKQVTKH